MQRVTSSVRDALLPVAGRMQHALQGAVDDIVLILQPDHLGDIVLSQPAVQHLRDKYPDSRLIAVVGPWSREITSMAWPVDEIVTVAFPGFTRDGSGSVIAPYRQLRAEAERLRSLRPRAAYVLRPDAWWAAWLASMVSPVVVTADDRRTRQFATHAVSLVGVEHATSRSLHIAANESAISVRLSSPLQFPTSTEHAAEAHGILRLHGVPEQYLVIHPGSGAAVKEWPVHRWRSVAETLSAHNTSIVLTGSADEVATCSGIASDLPKCVSLAGLTSVPILAEVMHGATLVLGPDCGPLHLAVATATPTVHLFGPSDPRKYGPWGDPERHRVVTANWSCPRCGDLSPARPAGCGCMLAIQPVDVIAAARSVLNRDAD